MSEATMTLIGDDVAQPLASMLRAMGWLCAPADAPDDLISALTKAGYAVTRNESPWETPGEFCNRVGLNHGSFARSLRAPCRPQVELSRGPAGRVLLLRSNQEFETWLRKRQARSGALTTHQSKNQHPKP